MKAPDRRWSTPIRRTCTHSRSIGEPGPGMAPTPSLTTLTSGTSPHWLISFGKAGAVRTDHRTRIGLAPLKNCGPAIERELRGRQGCQARICPAGPLPQVLLESRPRVDYRRRGRRPVRHLDLFG